MKSLDVSWLLHGSIAVRNPVITLARRDGKTRTWDAAEIPLESQVPAAQATSSLESTLCYSFVKGRRALTALERGAYLSLNGMTDISWLFQRSEQNN